MSPEFHLEDAANYSNYIKVSDSHIQSNKLFTCQRAIFRSLNNGTLSKSTGSGHFKKKNTKKQIGAGWKEWLAKQPFIKNGKVC